MFEVPGNNNIHPVRCGDRYMKCTLWTFLRDYFAQKKFSCKLLYFIINLKHLKCLYSL